MTAITAAQRNPSSTRARDAVHTRSARRSRSRVRRASEMASPLRPNGTTRPCGPPSGKKRGIGASTGCGADVAGRVTAAAPCRCRRTTMPHASRPTPANARPALPPSAGPPSGKAAAAVAIRAPVATSAVIITGFISSFAVLGGLVNGAFQLFCRSHRKARAVSPLRQNSAAMAASVRHAPAWASNPPTSRPCDLSARPQAPLACMLRQKNEGNEEWL